MPRFPRFRRRSNTVRAAGPVTEMLERRTMMAAGTGLEHGKGQGLHKKGAGEGVMLMDEAAPQPSDYVLGSKWSQPGGLGSSVNLSYSFSNLLDGGLPGGLTAASLESAIEEALQVWSAVAPLKFVELADSGPAPSDTGYAAGNTPILRFGHHYIDGNPNPNTLAHAYYPSPNGLGGDLHFDNGNTWGLTPSSTAIDMIEVATHEIGHSLGIDHEETNDAILNPYYGRRFSGLGSAFLLQDDINAVQAQYGAGVGYVLSDGVLHLSGTAGADVLGVDASGSNIVLSRGGYSTTVAANSVSSIVVNARGGNDAISVLRTGGKPVTVTGYTGNDALTLGSATVNLGDAAGAITYNGGAGTDALSLNDASSTFTGTYLLDAGTVGRTGFGGVAYSLNESLAVSTSDASSIVNVINTTAGVPVTLSVNGGDDVVNVFATATGAGVTVRTGAGADTLNVNADNIGTAGVLLDQSSEQIDLLALGAGGAVTLAATPVAGENVLDVRQLSINAAGKLDLNNGGMIVDAPSPATIAMLQTLLASGRAGGTWRGNGISSSAVTGTKHALGVAGSAEALGISDQQTGTWLGRAVDATSALVRYTLVGDATLNGRVDGDDYLQTDRHAGQATGNRWFNGDYNYDGRVNGDDYFLIKQNSWVAM